MPGRGADVPRPVRKRYPREGDHPFRLDRRERHPDGPEGYIVKSISPIDLPAALRQAIEGNVFSAIGMPEHNDSAARAAGLTDRETAILTALARGLSNEAIGKELWVAEQTVKFHLTNIYRKLGVSNRTEAARLAYQNGLVEMPVEDH
jgi:DNA-binding NarL/FixJ family response regulator